MGKPIAGHTDVSVYRPRNPRTGGYYQCVESHFEELEQVWDDRCAHRLGFYRPYIDDVIHRYLECGDLHFGFARVKYQACGHEYLLAYSSKRRQFCPSCHQKRVVEYGQWLLTHVLKDVPHRQWVFSIPKKLRIYFMYDRKLLARLSKCGWNVIRAFLKSATAYDDEAAGASIAVQTYGDFLDFNPHLHAIVPDGCFLCDGSFQMAPKFHWQDLEEAFQYEVLKMLKKEGKINDAIIDNMLSWHHSGFHVYMGRRIWPHDETGLENLAKYIVRACFCQERMVYIPAQKSTDGLAKVIYTSKDGRRKKTFNAVDWLAQLVIHIPDRYTQTVRYYGYYSNKSRDMRKKAGSDAQVPALVESAMSSTAFRKNWARLIQKIYQIDPLLCPKCQGAMKVISFIEDDALIKKILKHLGLWETRNHDPPQLDDAHTPSIETELIYDYTY